MVQETKQTHRDAAIRAIADRYAAKDSFIIGIGPGLFVRVSERIQKLDDWAIWADNGTAESLHFRKHDRALLLLSYMEFVHPGGLAAVAIIPKTVITSEEIAELIGSSGQEGRDIILATRDANIAGWPALLVEAITLVDPELGAKIRRNRIDLLN